MKSKRQAGGDNGIPVHARPEILRPKPLSDQPGKRPDWYTSSLSEQMSLALDEEKPGWSDADVALAIVKRLNRTGYRIIFAYDYATLETRCAELEAEKRRWRHCTWRYRHAFRAAMKDSIETIERLRELLLRYRVDHNEDYHGRYTCRCGVCADTCGALKETRHA